MKKIAVFLLAVLAMVSCDQFDPEYLQGDLVYSDGVNIRVYRFSGDATGIFCMNSAEGLVSKQFTISNVEELSDCYKLTLLFENRCYVDEYIYFKPDSIVDNMPIRASAFQAPDANIGEVLMYHLEHYYSDATDELLAQAESNPNPIVNRVTTGSAGARSNNTTGAVSGSNTAFTGGNSNVYTYSMSCYACHGDGHCDLCHGTGFFQHPYIATLGYPCPMCQQTGVCPTCKGAKVITTSVNIGGMVDDINRAAASGAGNYPGYVPSSAGSAPYSSSSGSSSRSDNPRYGYRDCHLCYGTGTCNGCNGSGTQTGYGTDPYLCANCGGTTRCRGCNGTGKSYGVLY